MFMNDKDVLEMSISKNKNYFCCLNIKTQNVIRKGSALPCIS
jgi:hypothetical protein